MTEMDREWFAIRSKPHKETLAQINFERQGFSVFLPTIQKTVRHARQTKSVVRPFFPGYLFLHLSELEQNWPTISSTRGVLNPVKFGDRYPVVPDVVIEELKNRIDTNGHVPLVEEYVRIKKGQAVKVVSGELEGLYGMFQCVRGEDRAIVLLDFLRRATTATVPLASIEKV